MSIFSKISEGLKKTRESMSGTLGAAIKVFHKVDEDFLESLEEALIMSDVGAPTAEFIIERLRKEGKGIKKAEELKEKLVQIITGLMEDGCPEERGEAPEVILILGVNGAGKTTTAAKLAYIYKSRGKKVLLAAADTFRAAAIEQLEIWAQRAGADIVKHREGSDSAAVVYDSISAAKARGTDVLICDTAGRLHNKTNLMAELTKINSLIERELPNSARRTFLVLDATTGQNAINQAKEFMKTAPVNGIILTKLDGTAKGGMVIHVKRELGVAVKYIGVGEKMEDLQPFDAGSFARALFE